MEILPQLLVNALIAGSIYALASSGLSLSYGLLRVLSFAHGHLMMAGAYAFYLLSVEHEAGLLTASAGTLLFALALGAATLRVFVLPFSKHSFLLTFVTSLTLATVLESLVSLFFGVNVRSFSAGSSSESFELCGVYITPVQIVVVASALLVLGLVALLLHCSSLGRRIRAVSQNTHAAQSLGVSRLKMSYFVFILGTVLAAYAGVLVGYETNIQPTMGELYTVKAFAAMVLGGLGNFWGTIASSYILGLVENLSVGLEFGGYSMPAGYKDAFAFVIILLVLLVKPEGIFSRARRKD